MRYYVLGLDVSMNSTGWAVLLNDNGNVQYVDSGVIKVNTKQTHGQRLRQQRNSFKGIVEKYNPKFVAREAGFSQHRKSTQALFKAYGVAEEFFSELNLVEYPASTIKKYVTGKGKANKEEVEESIRKILGLQDYEFASDDESDAIAVALTFLFKAGVKM